MAEVHVPTFEGKLLSNLLVGLPIVSSVIDYSSKSYQRSKDYHPLVNKSLSAAEGAVGVIVSKSKPFLSVLEKPVSVADHLGGKAVDVMAANVPVVTNPTELIQKSREVMSQLRTRGGQVVEAMADKVPVIVQPANVIHKSREVMGQLRTRGGQVVEAMADNVPVLARPANVIQKSREVMGQLRFRGGQVVEAMADKVPVIVQSANVIHKSREVMGQLRTRGGEFVEAMTGKVPVFTRPAHVDQYLDQLKTRAMAIREPGTYAYNTFRRVITHSGVESFYGQVIVSYASAKESWPNKIKVIQTSVQNELNLISKRYSGIRNMVNDFKMPEFVKRANLVNAFVAVKSFSLQRVATVWSSFNSFWNQLSTRMVSQLPAVHED